MRDTSPNAIFVDAMTLSWLCPGCTEIEEAIPHLILSRRDEKQDEQTLQEMLKDIKSGCLFKTYCHHVLKC